MKKLFAVLSCGLVAVNVFAGPTPDVEVQASNEGTEARVGISVPLPGEPAPARNEVAAVDGPEEEEATVGQWVADNWGKCLLGVVAAGGVYAVGSHNEWWDDSGDKDSNTAPATAPSSVDGQSTPVVVSTGDGSPVSVTVIYSSYNVGARRMPWRPSED